MLTTSDNATALIIGSTGRVGSRVAESLERLTAVKVRRTSRQPSQVDQWLKAGKLATLIDLDDPSTFAAALAGVDRLFLSTGYTVAMLAQSKTLVDAAIKAGVQHIVHLGVFANWDCTDPHMLWHLLVESYIKASGIAWTHLHPNMFMDQLPLFAPISADRFPIYWGRQRVGFIDPTDVASVAAHVLNEGPSKHSGKDYWLSPEVANGEELSSIFSEVMGRSIKCNYEPASAFSAFLQQFVPKKIEAWYAAGAAEFVAQVADGRMGYIGTVRYDGTLITGQRPTTLRTWIAQHSRLFEGLPE